MIPAFGLMYLDEDIKMEPDFYQEFQTLCNTYNIPRPPDNLSDELLRAYSYDQEISDLRTNFIDYSKFDIFDELDGADVDPMLFKCVSPNVISPDKLHPQTVPHLGPVLTEDMLSQAINDDIEPMNFPIDIISDEFLNSLNSIKEEPEDPDDAQISAAEETCSEDENVSENSYDASLNSYMSSKPNYHLDFDHCYSAPPKDEDPEEDAYSENIFGSPPFSPYSTSSTSSEVDVVTVSEVKFPRMVIVPKVVPEVIPKVPAKRGRKPKNAQCSLNPKSLKAAMKSSRITTVRRTYRRKINSIETSPSNSTQSSRCSSDVEDAGKRANHNSSERKRREVLRTALQNLRKSVPATELNEKAPKVLILNSAADYCVELRTQCEDLKHIKKQEEQKLKRRKAELRALQSYFAKHHS